MAKVELSHVEKIYKGKVNAVHDVSLTIHDGEFLVITGPSGCGKTTLLRMIAGLEDPGAGDIKIGENSVADIPPKDRNLAMVSQTYSLYPQMTVYKNMAFGLEMKKMPPDEIDLQVHRAAKLLELESLLNRKPKTLSGGQLQRVALGRAIVREPEVFLLDEPLSNLDASFRTNMRLQIKRIHKKLGTTFIYVTHDQTEAMTMADRIVVMKDGVIQQVGTPLEIYNHPANTFTASFMGQPQMKFADSILTRTSEGYQVTLNGQPLTLSKREGLEDYVNKNVLLGIRPEDISPDLEFIQQHPKSRILAKVLDTNLIASDIYLTIECNDTVLTARADSACPLRAGVTTEFAVDPEHVHLFDPQTKCVI